MRSRDTWEMGVVNKSGWCLKILRAVRAYFYSQPPWSKASSYATATNAPPISALLCMNLLLMIETLLKATYNIPLGVLR